ncbi:hypothetical protein N9B60_04255, partial [Mariniblastus sp.]|nr:hypothetical protein [Mariniblastus sp.]
VEAGLWNALGRFRINLLAIRLSSGLPFFAMLLDRLLKTTSIVTCDNDERDDQDFKPRSGCRTANVTAAARVTFPTSVYHNQATSEWLFPGKRT